MVQTCIDKILIAIEWKEELNKTVLVQPKGKISSKNIHERGRKIFSCNLGSRQLKAYKALCMKNRRFAGGLRQRRIRCCVHRRHPFKHICRDILHYLFG